MADIGAQKTRFSAIIYVGLAGAAIYSGGWQHLETLTPKQIQSAMYYTITSFIHGVSSLVIPKFVVVILLAKLLNPGRTHKAIIWVLSILYLLMGAIMLVINFAQCSSAAAQWGAS